MRCDGWTALALAGVLASCGGSGGSGGTGYGTGPGPTCTPTATRVCMTSSNTFSPPSLTVSPGTQVTWQNGSSVLHTVTSNPGSGEVYDQNVSPNGSFSYTFGTAGTYEYFCRIHGNAMRGAIVVQ